MAPRQQLTRGVRTVRGLVVASVATIVAALSHVMGGGAAPSLLAMLLCASIALPFVVFLSGRKSPIGMLVSVAGTQALFHWLFVWISPAAADLSYMRWSSHAEHLAAMTRSWSPALAPSTPEGAQWFMLATHSVAVIVTCLMLRYADDAFEAIHRAWQRLRLRLTRAITLPDPLSPPHQFAAQVDVLPQTKVVAYSRTLRGPPAVSVSLHN